MDLIYGLPKQNLETFSRTLAIVINLSPDRLSLFNYAHMPHLFKSQALINAADLPSASEKLALLHMAITRLQAAGYVYVGMDHFAKPNDALVIAQQNGELQRNFQGYSTHGDCDLFAFGASSISAFGDIFVQNAKTIEAYQARISSGELAMMRGFSLSLDDKRRQFAINQLICHFRLEFADFTARWQLDAREYFAQELIALAPMVEDCLVQISDTAIEVLPAGRLLIRRICMVFDAYLQNTQEIRYSKVI
jgi:oxygen-independent coproporphyrinogen-3 oxidase